MAEKIGIDKCRYCSMMIPKDTKVCPYCRKRQGWTWPTKIFLALFFLVFFGFFLGSLTNEIKIPVKQEVTKKELLLTEKGKKIKIKYTTWSNEVCNTVAEKKIFLGMTEEQVRVAWGKPYKINTSIGSWGKHEQWVMHNSIDTSYLYFENGILKSMQQSK